MTKAIAPALFQASLIRVIPIHGKTRQFSGNNVDYAVCQFLDVWEDAIVNSNIVEDHEKVAIIRSTFNQLIEFYF